MLLILIGGSQSVNSSTEPNSPDQTIKGTNQGGKLDQPPKTDYEPIPLDRLIGIAQLIVVGEVSKVNDGTFTVRIAEALAGEASSSDIEIVQFTASRFEGAPRLVAYQPGQSFLLFLIKDEKHLMQKSWQILGVGGEGEMPVQDGFVFFHGRNVEGLPFGSYRVGGVERTIQRFDATMFYDAVRRYRSCFEWKPGKQGRPEPAKICDEAAMDQYARASAIHGYLTRLTAKRLTNK